VASILLAFGIDAGWDARLEPDAECEDTGGRHDRAQMREAQRARATASLVPDGGPQQRDDRFDQ